jgi:hypothetical protein
MRRSYSREPGINTPTCGTVGKLNVKEMSRDFKLLESTKEMFQKICVKYFYKCWLFGY